MKTNDAISDALTCANEIRNLALSARRLVEEAELASGKAGQAREEMTTMLAVILERAKMIDHCLRAGLYQTLVNDIYSKAPARSVEAAATAAK